METVPISTFKATCLELLERVRRTGEPILVTRRGKPVAEVIPPPLPAEPTDWLGMLRGTGSIVGDVVSPVGEEQEWEVTGT